MAERVYRDDAGAVAVMLFTTPAPGVAWLDWHTDPGDSSPAAVSRALRWAFAAGYHRVETGIPATDTEALATATAVGLRREGVSRQGALDRGRPVDLVRLARLAHDVDPQDDPLPTLASGFHRSLVAAGVVFSDPEGRILLLRTSYKAEWEIPGGLGEPGEGPAATARREVREELGLEVDLADLLVLDHSPATDRRPDMVAVIFDAGVVPESFPETLAFPDGEIVGATWGDIATIERHCSPALARRLRAIVRERAAGRLPGPALVLDPPRPVG